MVNARILVSNGNRVLKCGVHTHTGIYEYKDITYNTKITTAIKIFSIPVHEIDIALINL